MTERTKGIWAMIAVCVTWGLSPLFYRALRHVPAGEVLAHRTIWSLALFAAVLAWQGRAGALVRALRPPHLSRILIAAVMISVNWGLFIWSVQTSHGLEASLGYYIFPLVAVVLGVAVFGERLALTQWAAVALAGLAVALLAWGLGAAPWISLALASSFGIYGVVKKALPLDPILSVTAEVAVLAPLALIWLALVHGGTVSDGGQTGHFGSDGTTTILLLLSGPVTAIPLMLFARAAQAVDLATVGVIGYLNPTLQFLCAVGLFGEIFTFWHGAAFGLIWTALAVYSAAMFRPRTQTA